MDNGIYSAGDSGSPALRCITHLALAFGLGVISQWVAGCAADDGRCATDSGYLLSGGPRTECLNSWDKGQADSRERNVEDFRSA
jgi:hypothetical protein